MYLFIYLFFFFFFLGGGRVDCWTGVVRYVKRTELLVYLHMLLIVLGNKIEVKKK